MLHLTKSFTSFIACLALVISFSLLSPAQTATSARVKAEIFQLRQSLQKKPESSAYWRDAKTEIGPGIARASDAINSGRLFLSIEELSRAQVPFIAFETVEKNQEAIKSGMAGFTPEWEKANIELTAYSKRARSTPWDKVPAAVRALGEASQGTTTILLQASRAYAAVTSPESGFQYLGEAKASAQFAAFCHSLEMSGDRVPAFHSIQPQLQELQQRVIAAFVPPRSIEKHPNFIRLNSTLKLAQELDAAGLYAGSLYEYLDSMGQFAAIDAVVPNDQKQLTIRRAVTEARKKLSTAKQDDSIAQLFLERAEAALSAIDARKTANSDTAWKRAAIMADVVLPAYYQALAGKAPHQQPAGDAITVTLVRWPYT